MGSKKNSKNKLNSQNNSKTKLNGKSKSKKKLGSQSLNSSKKNLTNKSKTNSQVINQNETEKTTTEENKNEVKTENQGEKTEETQGNSNTSAEKKEDDVITEETEEIRTKKDLEVEGKLTKSIENTLQQINKSNIRNSRRNKFSRDRRINHNNLANISEDPSESKKQEEGIKGGKETQNNIKILKPEDEKKTEETKKEDEKAAVNENDKKDEEKKEGENNDEKKEEEKSEEEKSQEEAKKRIEEKNSEEIFYESNDQDIDFYDEPLICDIMTPPMIDENATFTWINPLSEYVDFEKYMMMKKYKETRKNKDLELSKDKNIEDENKETDDELKKDEKASNDGDENKESEDESKKDEKSSNDGDEGKENEDESKKDRRLSNAEEERILMESFEKKIDISNIIDLPVISFGVDLSRAPSLENIEVKNEDESGNASDKEEDQKYNFDDYSPESELTIVRNDTPSFDNEKVEKFADYFVNEAEEDKYGGDPTVLGSKKSIDKNDDEEEEENNEESVEDKDEDKASNAIDREVFIENLKAEIEKYDKNSAKNLFLQNKLFELFRKKQNDSHRDGDKSLIDQEQRYLSSICELKELMTEYDTLNNEKTNITDENKQKLDDKRKESEKLYQEFYKMKLHIAQIAKSSRAGKEFNMKVFEQLESLEKRKEEAVIIARLENIKLQNKLRRQELLLRQKEELADGLHLIDFEQLKIENQTYNEKIEERNEV